MYYQGRFIFLGRMYYQRECIIMEDVLTGRVITFSPTCLDSPFSISGTIQGARHLGTGWVHFPSDPQVALYTSKYQHLENCDVLSVGSLLAHFLSLYSFRLKIWLSSKKRMFLNFPLFFLIFLRLC